MNKIEVHPKTEEIKKCWLENKEKMSTHAIWKQFVEKHFKPSDMFIFYKTVQKWEKEEIQEMIKGMSYYDIRKFQKENKRMITILLNRNLKKSLNTSKPVETSEINKLLKLCNLIEKIEKKKRRRYRQGFR